MHYNVANDTYDDVPASELRAGPAFTGLSVLEAAGVIKPSARTYRDSLLARAKACRAEAERLEALAETVVASGGATLVGT